MARKKKKARTTKPHEEVRWQRMPFPVEDWGVHGQYAPMNAEEVAAFIYLCVWQFREGGLPAEAHRIARTFPRNLSTGGLESVLERLFPIGADGFRRNQALRQSLPGNWRRFPNTHDPDEPHGKAALDRPAPKMRKKLSPRTRFAILKRDGFTCVYCGRKAPVYEMAVDHYFPCSRGGSNDSSNLRTACVECNAGKSDLVP